MTIRRRVSGQRRRVASYDLFLVLSVAALFCWGAWQYSVMSSNMIEAFYPRITEGPLPEGPFAKYRKVKPPDSPPGAIGMATPIAWLLVLATSSAAHLPTPVSWLQVLATSSAVHLQAILEEAEVLDRKMVRWNWEAMALCDRMVKESMVI